MNPIARFISIVVCLVVHRSSAIVAKVDDESDEVYQISPPGGAIEPIGSIGEGELDQKLRYKGTITACDSSPTTGRMRSTDDFHYYKVWLQAGTRVIIEVKRMTCQMDPVATLFYGKGNLGSLQLVAWGNNINVIPKKCQALPDASPHLDPKFIVKPVPYTGEYTLQVYQNALTAVSSAKYKIKTSSKDLDGDGVGDACDRCPLTNMKSNVTVLDCQTGVQDFLVTDYGCSLNDEMLKYLRGCMDDAKATSTIGKEIRAFFKKCMSRKFRGVVGEEESEEIMQCVKRTSDKDIQSVCGNRFLATDQQELYVMDPATGGKQFLGEILPFPRCSQELEYDYVNGILWSSKCGGSSELYKIDPTNGASIDSIEHERGDLTAMESIDGTLYAVFEPARDAVDVALAEQEAHLGPPAVVRRGHGESFSSPVAAQSLVDKEESVSAITSKIDAELVTSESLVPAIASTLVIVNTTTGDFTRIGPTGLGRISGLAYDKKRGIMWGVTNDPNSFAELVVLDLETGLVTSSIKVVDRAKKPLGGISSLEFGPDGRLYAGMSEYAPTKARNLITIDWTTGIASRLRDTKMGVMGLTCFTI